MFVASTILLVALTLCCQSPALPDEFSLLIKGLVSTNQSPNPRSEMFVGYPEGYDYEAQERVFESSKKLEQAGFAAIPSLLSSLEDQRYCRSVDGAILMDWGVGQECFDILCRITNPPAKPNYDALEEKSLGSGPKGGVQRLGADGEWHFTEIEYLYLALSEKIDDTEPEKTRNESVRSWWREFSNLTIDHIHLDALKKTIAYEEKIGFQPDDEKRGYLSAYRKRVQELENRISNASKMKHEAAEENSNKSDKPKDKKPGLNKMVRSQFGRLGNAHGCHWPCQCKSSV